MLENSLQKRTKKEVLKTALDYFRGDELSADVWTKKYCLKDDKHYYENTPDDMHWRIAIELARVESKYPNPLSVETIYETLKNFKRIIPQGSPMAGIGNNFQIVSLSNCFVIGNEGDSDSYGGIMKLDQELVQLQKRRGGVGLDLSFVRTTGSPVKNSAITSTGVPPFMERYSRSTKEVAQDGRRGALMESIHIKHPDSERFIDAKLEAGMVTGANISVKLDDEFMTCAMEGKDYKQQYPINSRTPSVVTTVSAEKLWKKIIHNAWKSAEPGILFWDTIINNSVADCYAHLGYETISTNPCGEIPLCADDSCRLLALNLFGYVVNPFTDEAYFDWDLFLKDAGIAQRYMDDIIDLEIEKIDAILEKINSDPESPELKRVELELWERIKDKTIRGRRTGLGVTGEGDMLAGLGMIYGTDRANDFSELVHQQLKLQAYRSSVIMAKERGAFPIFDVKLEENNPFIRRIKEEDPELYDMMEKYGRRNISLLTIAPTGTVSIMAQTTSGIEPVYLPVYTRRRKINPQEKGSRVDFTDEEGITWQEYPVFHHNFELWLEKNGYDVEKVKKMTFNQIYEEIVPKSPYYNATSNDVDWVKKVEMQGRIQKHVDHSISVTVNLPGDVTEEIVAKVYETGWRTGCFPKGQSVYTLNGIKDISEIKRGDMVYGVDKRLHNVNDVFVLPKEERILHHIKASGLEEISATSEHPFYVIELDESENKKSWIDRKKEFKWKLAKDIKPNDHLVVPNSFENITEEKTELFISQYLNVPTIVENDNIFLARKLPWKKDKLVKSANSNSTPNTIKITDDFLRFIGWFIAEGHYNGKSEIRLTLNKEKELDILLELAEIVEEVFGIETFIEETVGNAVRLRFHSRIVSLFLEKLVGRHSKNKHLPDWYQFLEPNKLNILLKSYYLGDGGTTISAQLARELFHAKILVNKKPYFKPNYGEGYYVNESTQDKSKRTAKEYDGYLCYRVNRNTHEIYEDNVYNLAVDDVDSYVVNGAIVHNCKGITVYRDGSRSGVLVSGEKKDEPVPEEIHVPRRPKRLKADIHRFQNNLEKWIAVVGLNEGRPYEIFTGKYENGLSELPTNLTECEVVKNIVEVEEKNMFGETVKKKVKRYDIEYVDKDGHKHVHTGLNHAFDPEYWNYAKLVSGVLRHKMPLVYVQALVNSLTFKEDHINTWKNGVTRTIKRYIKDGEKGTGHCPECGSENLVYKEGCLTCMSCGNSKCGT